MFIACSFLCFFCVSVYLALLRGGIQEEALKGVQISRAKRVVIVPQEPALDPYHRNQPAIVPQEEAATSKREMCAEFWSFMTTTRLAGDRRMPHLFISRENEKTVQLVFR